LWNFTKEIMSTTLLYHAWGTRGYSHVRTTFFDRSVCFAMEQDPDTFRCAHCGSTHVMKSGLIVRRFRSLPIGRRTVFIELTIQRLWCLDCGKTRQAAVAFADARRTYTHAFERYVLELSRHMTIKDVALHLNVGWDMVKDIQKRNLLAHYAKPRLKHLKHLAIDEISIGKGHRYLTVVLDLDSGAVVFVGEGKGAEALNPFWRRLKSSHARIRAVATDMSPAYIQAVRANLPKATLVFDHFHVIKLFNDKLSDLRRDVQREAEGPLQKKVLKGTRWLLLKNPENLDPKRNETKRLEEALRLNQPLATAYYMKEDLRQLWMQEDKARAESFLNDWIARAQVSGVRMLQQFAVTLAAHRSGLLAWYDCPISTGPLEGTNTKIRVMQHQAYGFRDAEFFRLKIYALHETCYALVG
jgi:transposase